MPKNIKINETTDYNKKNKNSNYNVISTNNNSCNVNNYTSINKNNFLFPDNNFNKNHNSSDYIKSNFNLEDYSDNNLNKYQVDRKSVFKSFIAKNTDNINNYNFNNNFHNNKQNSLNKKINFNNKNFLHPAVNASPLKCSLTIQKLDTPPRNKHLNKALNVKSQSNDLVFNLNQAMKSTFDVKINYKSNESNAYLNRLGVENSIENYKQDDAKFFKSNDKEFEGKIKSEKGFGNRVDKSSLGFFRDDSKEEEEIIIIEQNNEGLAEKNLKYF